MISHSLELYIKWYNEVKCVVRGTDHVQQFTSNKLPNIHNDHGRVSYNFC